MKKDSEKREVLIKSGYADNTKRAIYINTIGSNDSLYNTIMSKTDIDINKYLRYKHQEFESDKEDDGTVSGKAISGSRKKKAYNYVQNMNISIDDARLLLATEYSLVGSDKNKVAEYVNTFKIPAKDKLEIYGKLKGFTVYKNGSIGW